MGVFAASFRFEVSKKRLNYLTFEDIMSISLVLIDDWIDYGGGGGGGKSSLAPTPEEAAMAAGDELYEPTLDKDFLTSLRDLKTLQDRDKEHRNVVCCRLRSANQISSSMPKTTSSSSSTLGS